MEFKTFKTFFAFLEELDHFYYYKWKMTPAPPPSHDFFLRLMASLIEREEGIHCKLITLQGCIEGQKVNIIPLQPVRIKNHTNKQYLVIFLNGLGMLQVGV